MICAGILKSMMGLSGSVYTTIYAVSARPHALSFLLFIALALPVLTLLAAPTFNAVPFRQPGELPEPGRLWSNSEPLLNLDTNCVVSIGV